MHRFAVELLPLRMPRGAIVCAASVRTHLWLVAAVAAAATETREVQRRASILSSAFKGCFALSISLAQIIVLCSNSAEARGTSEQHCQCDRECSRETDVQVQQLFSHDV
jgi:type IV secretory pathway VirB2 component (pilin)